MSNIQYEYVDESLIDENYKCIICKEPLINPTVTPCDHTYCQKCIEHWLNEGYSACPSCRHILSMNDLKPVSTRLILNILDRLIVKCSQCGQNGIQRGNFNDHLTKLCPKGTIFCSAFDIKCPWSGPREQLENHLNTCNYEKLRSVLTHLVNKNRQLEEQIHTLTNQVQTLQSIVQSPTRHLITFDKLFEIEKRTDSGILSELYEGLIWNNVWYMHEQWVRTNHALSGWKNAYTNGHICVAFNGKGSSMSICSRRKEIDTFSLVSFEATAAWLDNLHINIIGRRLKQELYSKTIVLQFDNSQIFYFDWKNIDELQFIPVSGKEHPGIPYTDKYFAITWILLG
ncbi:unnamed protein product [Adineta steineri]|uniref:RING-type domain-containing protein n=1 Tax=Adineta steineri TaxID=433720 RepID=A0A815JU31_9BILA|nr:unnamed protein product [Adineta steineri]CAF3694538.1 unnamed protein product [Adineta steineri]